MGRKVDQMQATGDGLWLGFRYLMVKTGARVAEARITDRVWQIRCESKHACLWR